MVRYERAWLSTRPNRWSSSVAHIDSNQNIPRGTGNLLAQIVWSTQGGQALLLVNHQPQAVFDFVARRGYCRAQSDVPKDQVPTRSWNQNDSEWSDDALRFF